MALTITAFIAVIITIIIVVVFNIESMLFMGLILAAIWIMELVIIDKYMLSPEDKMTYITFSKEDESATLHRRNHRVLWKLKVVPVNDFYYRTHDAELVYTGATVGGVHMGGFHVNPAYKTAHLGKSTGKCKFEGELDDGNKIDIKKIYLTDELVEAAKKDPFIKKYLVGKTLQLRKRETKEIKKGKEMYATALKLGDPYAEQIFKESVYFPSMLTVTEGEMILRWIGTDTSDEVQTQSESKVQSRQSAQPSNMPGWKCTCGRTNAAYVSTCVCGISKRDILIMSKQDSRFDVGDEGQKRLADAPAQKNAKI